MPKKKTLPVRKKDVTPQQPQALRKVTLEINTNQIEESIKQVVEKVQYWYNQGMIHKVRLKYKGKTIMPDIPLSYFMLVQVATFFLTGVVRALAINLGTRVFFEVEMINDAEEMLKRGRDLYLDGELDEAFSMFEEVIKMDKNYAEAYLYLGIIQRIRKEPSASRYFQHAQKLDPSGKVGQEAARNLKKIAGASNI